MDSAVCDYEYIEMCKNDHLTIEDLYKYSVGDKLELVIWHANYDLYYSYYLDGAHIAYDATRIFQSSYCQVIFKDNLKWEISFLYPIPSKTYNLNIELEHCSLDKQSTWIPLKNVLLINTTRIGWNGPCMLWSKLQDYDIPVYYNID